MNTTQTSETSNVVSSLSDNFSLAGAPASFSAGTTLSPDFTAVLVVMESAVEVLAASSCCSRADLNCWPLPPSECSTDDNLDNTGVSVSGDTSSLGAVAADDGGFLPFTASI